MRNGTGTLSRVSPRARDEPPGDVLDELRRIAAVVEGLRPAVLRALDAGGSVRVVAEAAGLSPSTVQKWKDAAR